MAAQTAFFKLAVCLLFIVVAQSYVINKSKLHKTFEDRHHPMQLAAIQKMNQIDVTNQFLWIQSTKTVHVDVGDKEKALNKSEESIDDFGNISAEDYNDSRPELGERAGIIKHTKCPVGHIKVSGQCFPAGSLD